MARGAETARRYRQTNNHGQCCCALKHACLCTCIVHTYTQTPWSRHVLQRRYIITPFPMRGLVIYKYITPKLDTIEIRNTVQQLSENEEKENTGEMILYGRDLSASQLISWSIISLRCCQESDRWQVCRRERPIADLWLREPESQVSRGWKERFFSIFKKTCTS